MDDLEARVANVLARAVALEKDAGGDMTAGDVHVPTADCGADGKKRKKKPLAERVAEMVEKQNRWPAGTPAGKGGQFAPGKHGSGGFVGQQSLFGWGGSAPKAKPQSHGVVKPLDVPWFTTADPALKQQNIIAAHDMKALSANGNVGALKAYPVHPDAKTLAEYKTALLMQHGVLPPGATIHPAKNDKGQPVGVLNPSAASPRSTWTDPSSTATFVPGGPVPSELHGVKMEPWHGPSTIAEWKGVEGTNPRFDALAGQIEVPPGKHLGAGVIVVEPDGRVWLTKPTNGFGGYANTFPKGTVEDGLSLQQSAIKEAYEETGLKVEIAGVLGDYERTTSVARYYIARRVGGTPANMGWESQAIRLAPPADMAKLLNMKVDQNILDDLLTEQHI